MSLADAEFKPIDNQWVTESMVEKWYAKLVKKLL